MIKIPRYMPLAIVTTDPPPMNTLEGFIERVGEYKMDSRENLHPLWSDLSARADAARKEYRESAGDYAARFKFMHTLSRLGFDQTGIAHELRENNPNPQPGPGG